MPAATAAAAGGGGAGGRARAAVTAAVLCAIVAHSGQADSLISEAEITTATPPVDGTGAEILSSSGVTPSANVSNGTLAAGQAPPAAEYKPWTAASGGGAACLGKPTQQLTGGHFRVAFYGGELDICTPTYDRATVEDGCESGATWCPPDMIDTCSARYSPQGTWSGYSVDLLKNLAALGNFTYEIVSMGSAEFISGQKGGYTGEAEKMLTLERVDFFGQGTWRMNAFRADVMKWVWSVPVVSVHTTLVQPPPKTEEKPTGAQMFLFFKPFTAGAWWSIFFIALLYMLIMVWVQEREDVPLGIVRSTQVPGQQGPVSVLSRDFKLSVPAIFYDSVMSLTHEYQWKAETQLFRVVQGSWIFFVFLLGSVYGAELTGFLTRGVVTANPYNGLKGLMEQGGTLCLNEGSANWDYFRPEKNQHFHGLRYKNVSGVAGQIAGIMSGACDAAEFTREDVYLWAKLKPNNKCGMNMVGPPIATRNRGMMMPGSRICLHKGINALFQELSILNALTVIDRGLDSTWFSPAQQLHSAWFPNPECTPYGSKRDTLQIEAINFSGLVILFFINVIAVIVWNVVSPAD